MSKRIILVLAATVLLCLVLSGLLLRPGANPSSGAEPASNASGRPQLPSAGPAGTVYLTFDDGPGPFTDQVLSILRQTESTATFFQLGMNRPGYDAVSEAIQAQGSNIGNHSYSHLDLTELDPAKLQSEIADGPHAKCFRPPFGSSNEEVKAAITSAGMREVLWDVDSQDWAQPGVEKLKQVGDSAEIQNGSILLMHDGGDTRQQTLAALGTIIEKLRARGFVLRALPYC